MKLSIKPYDQRVYKRAYKRISASRQPSVFKTKMLYSEQPQGGCPKEPLQRMTHEKKSTEKPGRERSDRSERPSRSDAPKRSGHDRPARPDRPFRSDDDRSARPERSDRPGRSERSGRNEQSDRPVRSPEAGGERADRPRRPFRPEGERSERSHRPEGDRPHRSDDDRAARSDRPRRPEGGRDDRADRPRRSDDDRAARSDRPQRPADDRGERSDRPRRPAGERSEHFDRPRRPFRDDERGERGDRPSRPFRDDERSERGDRPGRPFRDDARGERSDRPFRSDDRGERGDRPGRPPHSGDDQPAFDPERLRGAAGALVELDLDLMKLLVRRAKLVSRVRDGKTHASTPRAVQSEKAVRMAFEKNAAAFSKDPRFSRQLFELLQDLRVLSHEESTGEPGFHLSPPRKPVNMELSAPAAVDSALLWAALAAFTGKGLRLERVAVARGLVHGIKALNGYGADARLIEHTSSAGSVEVAAGAVPLFAGKSIHVGDSFAALYLTIFAALAGPGVCKFTGGSALKQADLSFFRHTLPELGARLAHVMPQALGLPASLECSGMLPETFKVRPETPAEALPALLLAPLIWNTTFTLDLGDIPAESCAEALAAVQPMFAANAGRVRREDELVFYTPGDVQVPEQPEIPADPTVCAYFAALPALVGGEVRLKGLWPDELPEAAEALALLQAFGVGQEQKDHMTIFRVASFANITETPAPPIQPELLPLWACLCLSRTGGLPETPELSPLVAEYREHLQWDDRTGPATPWVCADAFWGMAFALAAFARPSLRLVNPDLITERVPAFWPVYNGLPEPADPAVPVRREKKDDAPTRRRVVAD